MGKGVIWISPGIIKEFLRLPEDYTVEQVTQDLAAIINHRVGVVVDSPSIPETPEGAQIPAITPCYCQTRMYEGLYNKVELVDINISPSYPVDRSVVDIPIEGEIKGSPSKFASDVLAPYIKPFD